MDFNYRKNWKKSIDTKDQMIILFGEGANQDLEDVSVIQNLMQRSQSMALFLKKATQLQLMAKLMLQIM